MISRLSDFKLWCIFFLYTCIISAFIQLLLLPYFLPFWHAGGGLLNTSFDSICFHRIAVDLADNIHKHGWSAWKLRPFDQTPAGIASIFYFLIAPKLWTIIPLNAALHASAALLLVKIIELLLKNQTKSVVCAMPFLIFPSSLQWVSQLHKDGYTILGITFILYSIIILTSLINTGYKRRNWVISRFAVFSIAGIYLILPVRPFILTILLPLIIMFFSLIFSILLAKGIKKEIASQEILFLLIAMLLPFLAYSQMRLNFLDRLDFKDKGLVLEEEIVQKKFAARKAPQGSSSLNAPISVSTSTSVTSKKDKLVFEKKGLVSSLPTRDFNKRQLKRISGEVKNQSVASQGAFENKTESSELNKIGIEQIEAMENHEVEAYWKRSFGLPLIIENKLYSLALSRRGYRTSPLVGARSYIDLDVGFNSAKAMLFYLPRAAQIAFLAPFPVYWFAQASYPANNVMRRISAFEMLITYFALFFLFYALWHWHRRIEIWIVFLFCVYMLFIYGLVICNVGTLYRMRYPYLTTLIALGIAGFFAFMEQRKKANVN